MREIKLQLNDVQGLIDHLDSVKRNTISCCVGIGAGSQEAAAYFDRVLASKIKELE